MFLDRRLEDGGTDGHNEVAGLKLQPVASFVTTEERYLRYQLQPTTILVTGLSGAGKSTVASALERKLFNLHHTGVVLDGENMRLGLSRDLGFSAEESSENLRRAGEVAKIINAAGQFCIAAFVAPQKSMRDQFRAVVGDDKLVHVHLSTDVKLCRERDSTGRYAAADRGDIPMFPGVSAEYEQPREADVVASMKSAADTERLADEIIAKIKCRS